MGIVAKLLDRVAVPEVYAHCDIPCGVYSAEPSKIAARAVVRMVELISELPTKGSGEELLEADNNFMRMVSIKEREAQRCKDELLVLWTDYFKPEHLKQFPELHQTFWQAAKQCSKVKRTVSLTEAKKLEDMVGEIAGIFTKAEKAKA